MKTVLIVEDDPVMRRALKDNFQIRGYYALTARDGEDGVKQALQEQPDLILLDVMLPEMNGYEVCAHLREKNLDMPVIMLTAKGEESDIVLGLNLGADDYVTKPFSIRELMARAEAFMRRSNKNGLPVYEFGDCRLDVPARTFQRRGTPVPLTPGEFKMLHFFLKRSGCPLTRDEIRTAAWGYSHFTSARDIDRTVTALRGKIESPPSQTPQIREIENVGYMLELPPVHGNRTDC